MRPPARPIRPEGRESSKGPRTFASPGGRGLRFLRVVKGGDGKTFASQHALHQKHQSLVVIHIHDMAPLAVDGGGGRCRLRLHSHLLWVGLACHIVGFDTLFMQSFRIREPIMWIAEKITGNRKTYSLCVIGGVRWDITPEIKAELRALLDRLETEWKPVVDAVKNDRNIQKRTRGVGIADKSLVKNAALIGLALTFALSGLESALSDVVVALGAADLAEEADKACA